MTVRLFPLLLVIVLISTVFAHDITTVDHSSSKVKTFSLNTLFGIELPLFNGKTTYDLLKEGTVTRDFIVYCFAKGQLAYYSALIINDENRTEAAKYALNQIELHVHEQNRLNRRPLPASVRKSIITTIIDAEGKNPISISKDVFQQCLKDKH